MIKFIYFDLGQVLFSFSDGLHMLSNISGRPIKEVRVIFNKYDDDVCLGKIHPQDLWCIYQKELGFTKKLDFLNFWISAFKPIKEMHALVERCSNKYDVGILSNIYLEVFERIIKMGIIPNISYVSIVKSCDIQLVKPMKEIYRYAEEKISYKASEILFIDDKDEFLNPASFRGWQTFKFDRNRAKKDVSKLQKLLSK